MAFYARTFIFDDIPSENFGLAISSSDSGESSRKTSSDIEIKSQKIFRKPVPLFYGATQSPVLEFEAEVYTTNLEITAVDASIIQRWLFGQTKYKKLRIVQPDMEEIYYNCILKEPYEKRVGNIIVGYSFTVSCDSPYAWGNDKTVILKQQNQRYFVYNDSDNNGFTYPVIEFQASMNYIHSLSPVISGGNTIEVVGGYSPNMVFQIVNYTEYSTISIDKNTFTIKNLYPGEKLWIDCETQQIKTNSSVKIMKRTVLPLNFFKLVPGLNEISFSGSTTSEGVKITYRPMKVG